MLAQLKNKRGLNGIYLNQEKLKSDHKSEFGFHTAKQDDIFIYFTNEIKIHKLHQNHSGLVHKEEKSNGLCLIGLLHLFDDSFIFNNVLSSRCLF